MCSVITCHDVERNYEGIENVENASFLVRLAYCLITDKSLFAVTLNRSQRIRMIFSCHYSLDAYSRIKNITR